MRLSTTKFDAVNVLRVPYRLQSGCEPVRAILTPRHLLEILLSSCPKSDIGAFRTTTTHLSNFIYSPVDLLTLEDIVESLSASIVISRNKGSRKSHGSGRWSKIVERRIGSITIFAGQSDLGQRCTTAALATIFDYLREFSPDLGNRITEVYQPLHKPEDPLSPLLTKLKRKPLPAQALAIMGIAKFWKKKVSAKLVAECGCGKTLMAMAACYVHAAGKRFTTVVMCPPHLPKKWSREVLITLPNVRVFMVEDMRNNGDPKKPHGLVEVVYSKGKIVRKGLKLTLTELRQMGPKGFQKLCPQSAFFMMSKERGKLGYFWRDAFSVSQCGPNKGYLIGNDSGVPVPSSEGGYLTRVSFEDKKLSENHERPNQGSMLYSALWQADKSKIQRMAPLDYMGRYMKKFFDYAIADELHQLGGDTAQGNGLAVLVRISKRNVGLTGTMMGGFADDLFNIAYRISRAPHNSTNFSSVSTCDDCNRLIAMRAPRALTAAAISANTARKTFTTFTREMPAAM